MARPITAETLTYTCNSTRDSFLVPLTNGPNPASVPEIAIPAITKTAVAVSRGLNLKCRPDQEGDAEKLQGIVPDARRKEPTEHVLADEEYAREQNDSLCKLRSVPSKTCIPEPENK